jgi:hypothetical protein
MKRARVVPLFILAGLIVSVTTGTLWFSRSVAAAEPPAAPGKIAGTATGDDGTLFTAFVSVLRNPRCMNCHSEGDYPRQGDDGHRHTMNVRRGPDGHGVTSEKCSTCHQDHNLAGAHLPPGAPNWGLPPASTPMIWQGLTDAQICESIKNRKQNRNRNLDQLVEHLTADKLVMWAWNPGESRTPVPMPRDEFATKVKRWQAAGAPCPAR